MTARAMPAVRAIVQPLVPDAPAWVEAWAMTLDDDAWAVALGERTWVLGSDAARLLAVAGDAEGTAARDAVQVLAARTGWTLLAASDRDDVVAAARAVGRTA